MSPPAASQPPSQPLFEQIMGGDFARLPPTVRHLHAATGARRYAGQGHVERGRGWLARLCCMVARLPPTHAGVVEVDILSRPNSERWTRRFHAHHMRSRLWKHGHNLAERLGPVRFVFSLSVVNAALVWRVEAAYVFGMPLPTRWFAGVGAREFERAGRYRFDVFAELPLIGLLVRYDGWLDVAAPQRLDGA